MILDLKWIHLCFVCGVAMNQDFPVIWIKVAADPTKQEGLAILSQYLLMWKELFRREFHGLDQLLHVRGDL